MQRFHTPPERGSLSREQPGRVEDYTRPFLFTFCAWMFCALTLIWAIWGFVLAILISLAANQIITAGAARRAERAVRPLKAPPPPR